MRIMTLLAALVLLAGGPARAQDGAAPPASAAAPRGTGQGNYAVNPAGDASSSVNLSGTVRTVPMSDLARGANSFTEGQARTRIAGAGFDRVTTLTLDPDGVWRGRGDREGRTFDVGFDYKGQVAFR